MGVVRFLTDMGLFIGQSQAFFLLFGRLRGFHCRKRRDSGAILLTSRVVRFFVHRRYFLSSLRTHETKLAGAFTCEKARESK
jgi:hypothetical protein